MARFVKFGAKLLRAEMYDSTPQEFIGWLDKVGAKALVHDPRFNREVLVKDYQASRDLSAWKVYDGRGRWDHTVLADNEAAAMVEALVELPKHRVVDFMRTGRVERQHHLLADPLTLDNLKL